MFPFRLFQSFTLNDELQVYTLFVNDDERYSGFETKFNFFMKDLDIIYEFYVTLRTQNSSDTFVTKR